MSISASLESLNKSSDSIRSLYFTPSGVFTNALTLKPYITKLIRDALDYESAMYTVDRDTEEPRRVDGSRSYLEMDDSDQDLGDLRQKPTVRIPSMKIDPVVEKEDSKIHLMLQNLNNNDEEHSVEVIIETLKNLVDNDQSLLSNHLEIRASLEERSVKYQKLSGEVLELEQIVLLQKTQLNLVNTNINDRHILGDEKVRAKDLIAKEEAEILELEKLLMEKKRQDKNIRESIVNNQ